jgi:hypothetical protein
MDRETKELRIENFTFVVKTYATAREAQAIQQAYFKGMKVEVVGQEPKISEFSPAVQFDMQQEMIAQMVVSLDGNKENIATRCLDLPSDVYNELVTQLDDLVAKKSNRQRDWSLQHG